MTLSDYIKFNTNYGDMNQGKPLKRELLESIYYSIQQEQLLIVDDVGLLLIAMICSLAMRILSPLRSGMISSA